MKYMEELETTTVSRLLQNLKPNLYAQYSCTPEIMEKLSTLDGNCVIKIYGKYSFRLADDTPSYFIDQMLICK